MLSGICTQLSVVSFPNQIISKNTTFRRSSQQDKHFRIYFSFTVTHCTSLRLRLISITTNCRLSAGQQVRTPPIISCATVDFANIVCESEKFASKHRDADLFVCAGYGQLAGITPDLCGWLDVRARSLSANTQSTSLESKAKVKKRDNFYLVFMLTRCTHSNAHSMCVGVC